MSGLSLAAIYRYPVKSARGHMLESARMDAFGLAGDRRWMVVDEEGVFVSQRSLPELALLEVVATPRGLTLGFRDSAIEVATPPSAAPRTGVAVWGDQVGALVADSAAGDWLSACFGAALRLVYLPDDARRPVDPAYATRGERVAFADGFPLLLVSQASLDDLNSRLERPVPMDRFRPNLVVSGAAPFAEDGWSRLRVGDAVIDLVKPCSRCAIPSIDQATAARDRAINRVLAAFRRRAGQIFFGMNALGAEHAQFGVGDPVSVLR